MKILPISRNIFVPNTSTNTNGCLSKNMYGKSNIADIPQTSSVYNNISFCANERFFILNLSDDELRRRINHETFIPIRLIDGNSDAYKNLALEDKETLNHLIRAAEHLDSVYKKLDNPHNIEFEKYLNKLINLDSIRAYMTKKLYDGQKGIIGVDTQRDTIKLVKGIKEMPGKGFYPEDLSVEEFHKIIKKMLENYEIQEVEKILNQRSVVVRNGDKLKAIDYTEYFKDEFTKAAEELEQGARKSSNKQFAEYLRSQAAALRNNDPMLDCKADKLWAKLQDTPLEFTIGRECYTDEMTPTLTRNPEIKALLDRYGITAYAKDTIGARVGIVDKAGTEYLLKTKDLLKFMASKMPFKEQYVQHFDIGKNTGSAMVDVDIAYVSGNFAKYRGGITIASNLPNEDKLAVKTGGGRRMVYHKQLRDSKYPAGINTQKRLDALLDYSQHKYFSTRGIHDFCILHENVHSLGPKVNLEGLGTFKNKIEEFKADSGAFVMFDELRKKGFYTPQQEKECIISYLTGYVPKGHDISEAHSVSNMIQYNKFLSSGAITLTPEGRMLIDCKRVIQDSIEMLEDAIRLQLKGSAEEAAKYIERTTGWNDSLELLAKNLKAADKKLNSYIVAPLLKAALKK